MHFDGLKFIFGPASLRSFAVKTGGDSPKTVHAGGVFYESPSDIYESPSDIHQRKASVTEHAKIACQKKALRRRCL